MRLDTTMNRARAALIDPEVLALMRQDEQFQEFFDAEGNLLLDLSRPGVLQQVTEALTFWQRKRRRERA